MKGQWIATAVAMAIWSGILTLGGCGGSGDGGGNGSAPDYLLFYGDNSNSTTSAVTGNGLFKIQQGALWPLKIINTNGKSNVRDFTPLGDLTVFAACGVAGCEPWITDGTPDGTRLIKDINPFGDSNPAHYTLFNDQLFFAADDGQHGVELWKTDGTEKGTVMVKNIGIEEDLFPLPPLNPVSGNPQELTVFGDTLFFVANDLDYLGFGRGIELWKTDGSEAGTIMVRNIAIENPDNPDTDRDLAVDSSPHALTIFNGMLFFSATDGIFGPEHYGRELWRSDGTESGTVLVKDIGQGLGSYDANPQKFTIFEDALYFFADDGSQGYEPWKSDGTEPGTVLVANVGDDTLGPFPLAADHLTFWASLNGRLYFTADDGFTGLEPWSTGGGITIQLADLNPAGDSVVANRDDVFRVYNQQLFFFANDGLHGFEPWLTDGTLPGTLLLRDIYTGPLNAPTSASGLTITAEYHGKLYFTADDGLTGRELWVSDGTEIGTAIFKDIGPGYESGYSDAFGPARLDGALFFSAFDGRLSGGHGIEMWRTLGTEAETQLVEDLNPGAAYDGVLKSSPFPLP
jgi:ELWxxDGT repeat protein